MDFYVDSGGGTGKVTWANEDEYQQARRFLIDMGLPPVGGLVPRYETAEFFYVETREQWRAFLEFVKSVQEKRTKPPSLHMAFCVESVDSGTVTWANEDEYQQAQKFLLSIGVKPDLWPFARPVDPEYFSLDKEKYRAFLEFRKSIEKKRGNVA